jgi:hypothetical protein
VADAYRQINPTKRSFVLDFEYKQTLPDQQLVLKQVRALPASGSTTNVAPFLLNYPEAFEVYQGEYVFQDRMGDVFSNHRLKSQWQLATRNLRLNSTNLGQCFYTNIEVTTMTGAATNRLAGSPLDWPAYSHAVNGNLVQDCWQTGAGATQRNYCLNTTVPASVSAAQPIVTAADLELAWTVSYAEPLPVWDYYSLGPIAVTEETVMLTPRPVVTPDCVRQTRSITNGSVIVRTTFYWPKDPALIPYYTAPLVQFAETRIEGLTAQPLVLSNYFSQTYSPFHHNESEEFVFEPQRDPNVTEQQRAELTARNVQAIYVCYACWPDTYLQLLGCDGSFRTP